jgi:hypothetical protein
VAGSLRLLCAYPATDGQLASSLDPALSLTPLAASAAPQMRWYSASYSAHTVIALAEHWRQSGDLALVRELWSAVSGEIAWLLAQVGSQGLVVTDSGNGLDWHPQFGGPVVGAAGLTNLIVVKALLDAAELAKAQGLTSSATAWQAQAADLQAAMDSLLQDTSTGLYEVSDSRRGLVAQDVNALAVLWDRVPQERALQILDRLEAALATEQGHRAFSGDSAWSGVISPMVSGFEVAALFRAGRGNAALQLIRAGWRMMIEHATHACGTTWESMTDQGVPPAPMSVWPMPGLPGRRPRCRAMCWACARCRRAGHAGCASRSWAI